MTKDELLHEAMKYIQAFHYDTKAELKLRLGVKKLLVEYKRILEGETLQNDKDSI